MKRPAKGTMTTFVIKDPVFKTEPLFVLGCSAYQLETYLKKRFGSDRNIDHDSCGSMLTFRQQPWRVVWCKRFPRTPEDIGVLLHEIFHLVVRICGDKGVPILHHLESGECGDEAAAYLYEHFSVQALQKIRRVGSRHKEKK